jgi:hypothetical protein
VVKETIEIVEKPRLDSKIASMKELDIVIAKSLTDITADRKKS